MKTYLKKFSVTLIAFTILILLAGYLYFFELKKPSEEETKKEIFTDIKEEQINEIKLKYPNYSIVCNKEGGNWYVLKDSKRFKADEKIISTIIDSLSKIRIEKIVSENPKDLASFGLMNPQVEVVAKATEKDYRILVGTDSPVGSGTYIQADGDKVVLLVEKNAVMPFMSKSVNDLRDKQILALDESKIRKLRFQWKDSSFELDKTDGGWAGKDMPGYVQIDQARIESILKTFLNLKIDNFEEDETNALSTYELDKPRARIEIFENEKPISVLFGNKKEEGVYYVKLDSGDSVYSVSEFVLRQVPENVNDIRVRKLVNVEIEKVRKIEITRGESTILILKEGDNWELADDKDKKVDALKVKELLGHINDLEAERFVDDNPSDLAPHGLDKPEIVVTITEGDKITSLLFGKKEEKEVYVKLSESRSVYSISGEIISQIPSSNEELIKK